MRLLIQSCKKGAIMDNYFQARGVQASMYENFRLPMYFKEVLEGIDEGARILDFGCGFGQTLCAIKTAAKENAGGGQYKRAKIAISMWY